jgi:hypothetical protein
LSWPIFFFDVGFAWNDGLNASPFEESPDRIRIMAIVGEEWLAQGSG